MKLIVGLGNLGERYAATRHNLGFMVVDEVARHLGADAWKEESKFNALLAEAEVDGEKVLLAKPTTMMNLSGQAVGKLLSYYRIEPTALWVAYDEIDLPLGEIKIQLEGSAGGHQGVASVIGTVGKEFTRVRVGIDPNDRTREPSEEYVLKPFSPEQMHKLPAVIDTACDAVIESLQEPTVRRIRVFGD